MAASKKKSNGTLKAAPYLIASLIYILIFTILPILYTVWISLTNKTVYTKDGESSFVGLANFVDVFNGPFKEPCIWMDNCKCNNFNSRMFLNRIINGIVIK